jgi:hypothetical protein
MSLKSSSARRSQRIIERNDTIACNIEGMKKELIGKMEEFTRAANRKRTVVRDEEGLIKEII